ncbi:MAG: hypothetical protein A3D31_11395 [Candidatus Fluviicola riflensis]|nr:MAG: hypothetical protein CHH17_15820 [Candidatus Fluviicola riflensis]OGS77594.1 MAG: hypothetical protein A3D31_11395 [Candidatus Fluviicola riflensis]OGS84176.1 MAG: hypothetical protein A3E30_12800 [Fluviicola sp. RIFCSPHIGHO2_12_FULL_43_24]OGS84660.1 MAG: hypothetical protein A2724_08330 [Fluviicola sp. RIFCSPHIGHO2_01_FULL_43_53]
MEFCLNIVDIFYGINYRLKKDNTWQVCTDPKIVRETDFTTKDKQQIFDLQTSNRELTINGKVYIVNSTAGDGISMDKDLCYAVYGFYDQYPSSPDIQQLKAVLLNGNDQIHNTLILRTDSKFYLEPIESFPRKLMNPEIVVQFEGFHAENGFINKGMNESDFTLNLETYFRTGMSYWKSLLLNKYIHEKSDYPEGEGIDELLDIYDALAIIKNNWGK